MDLRKENIELEFRQSVMRNALQAHKDPRLVSVDFAITRTTASKYIFEVMETAMVLYKEDFGITREDLI